jgi:pimeloyl-ACP methyl ester carboxylesterase
MCSPGIPAHKVIKRVPLPGLVILVHGVNSDGEWYEQTEQGLCDGLLDRLGMREWAHADHPDVGLRPVRYRRELLPDGRIDQEVAADNFIVDAGRSPVIRFRYGYRCNDEEAEFKKRLMLNELEAWGGGPFQNGCSALADLWGPGLTTRVFWHYTLQDFNSIPGRFVYDAPSRAYYVHAAQRLARLVGEIRAAQPDCPITMLCHSQGNMIGMAAAFLGAAKNPDHVADTYILANPPYATRENSINNFGQRNVAQPDRHGTLREGEITEAARIATLAHLVKLVRARRGRGQRAAEINAEYECKTARGGVGWGLEDARPHADYARGLDRDNRGRVFLYCNPADQVIGVGALQGMGWQGLSDKELAEIDPAGDSFFVRVWAQGLKVGAATPTLRRGTAERPLTKRAGKWVYRYCEDHPEAQAVAKDPAAFWYPRSPIAKFDLSLDPNRTPEQRAQASTYAPLIRIVAAAFGKPLHDPPPKDHAVAISAPAVPDPIYPRSTRGGEASFVERGAGGPVHGEFDEAIEDPRKQAATPEGKAQQQYEYRARMRQQEALGALGSEEKLGREAYEAQAEREFERARNDPRERANATDHSTILTNSMHSRKVVAYDLAVGACWIEPERLLALRKLADWRRLSISAGDEYFARGTLRNAKLQDVYTVETIPAGIDTTRRRRAAAKDAAPAEPWHGAQREAAPPPLGSDPPQRG